MIGKTVWYEHARYNYAIQRTMYEPCEADVIGETPRKWVAKAVGGWKQWTFPKAGGAIREGKGQKSGDVTLYMSREALEAAQAAREMARWTQIHAAKVAVKVGQIRDTGLLRKVAALIGHDFEDDAPKGGG